MTEAIFENASPAPEEAVPETAEDTLSAVAADDYTPEEAALSDASADDYAPEEDVLPSIEEADISDLPPGMTEDGLRQFLRARHAREISADMRMHDHYAGLVRQAEELNAQYPGFDLAREMQNPIFVRLTAPGVGIDPGTAYEIVHRRSLREADRRAGFERAAQAVRSGSLRPSESALSGVYASTPVKTDPRNLSSDDRKAIRRRVERGERVTF